MRLRTFVKVDKHYRYSAQFLLACLNNPRVRLVIAHTLTQLKQTEIFNTVVSSLRQTGFFNALPSIAKHTLTTHPLILPAFTLSYYAIDTAFFYFCMNQYVGMKKYAGGKELARKRCVKNLKSLVFTDLIPTLLYSTLLSSSGGTLLFVSFVTTLALKFSIEYTHWVDLKRKLGNYQIYHHDNEDKQHYSDIQPKQPTQ